MAARPLGVATNQRGSISRYRTVEFGTVRKPTVPEDFSIRTGKRAGHGEAIDLATSRVFTTDTDEVVSAISAL